MSSSLVIRADADSQMGTGHIMRCLSLAEGWCRRGGSVRFACAEITPALAARLAALAIPVDQLAVEAGTATDANQTVHLAASSSATWVVLDGYHFDGEYQQVIKNAGLQLMVFDDYGHANRYPADIVLNQNLSANPVLYTQHGSSTRLLLGTRYALLRQEFLAYRNWQRETPTIARKVLVTLGGADPANVTSQVIEALHGLNVEARIVVGGANPHLEELRSQVSSFISHPASLIPSPSSLSLLTDVANMPELMAWADAVISAGGTTSYEIAFMGLPNLVLVLAENQRAVAAALDAAGVAQKSAPERITEDLRALLGNAERRAVMSRRGRQLVDGDGVNRVVACLRAASLKLRHVREADGRLIWEWANEPAARAVSLSSDPIPWETHVKWFAARVNTPGHLFYLATNGHDVPVGQIRYEITGDEAVVSVSLAKEARGRGYGAALIVRGSQQCFDDAPVKRIRAYIKPDNATSVRAFDYAGYVDAGTAGQQGQTVREFVLERV